MVWTEDFKKAIDILLEQKPNHLLLTKACEELNELSTILLKYINKPEKVSFDDIHEEIEDVKQHLYLLDQLFGESIEWRNKKIEKFLNSDDFLKYKAMSEEANI